MDRIAPLPQNTHFRPAAWILLSAVALAGCGTTYQISSRWSDRKVEIDGHLTDWNDSISFVESEGIRFGVMNDREYLYLSVVSSKPNLGRQLIARGMTVWFDPMGGEHKTIGLRFPIGAMRAGLPASSETGGRAPREGREGTPSNRRERIEGMERQTLNEFEFLGPGANDRQRVARIQGQGVEIHITATPERFVYEMKIPLAYSSQHPYAVESFPGATIGIGFDSTPQMRPAEGGPGGDMAGGAPPSGGSGGGRAGGRGGGGMRPAGMRQEATDVSFDVWVHVRLADKTL